MSDRASSGGEVKRSQPLQGRDVLPVLPTKLKSFERSSSGLSDDGRNHGLGAVSEVTRLRGQVSGYGRDPEGQRPHEHDRRESDRQRTLVAMVDHALVVEAGAAKI